MVLYLDYGRMNMDVKDYKQEIAKQLKDIDNEWILKQIYRCIRNITKED